MDQVRVAAVNFALDRDHAATGALANLGLDK